MKKTLKSVSYNEQMQGSIFSWKTSRLLFHAMQKGRVANFHGQTSDAYAYVWTVQGSLFSWITLWNLCHTLDRCKVAYIHGITSWLLSHVMKKLCWLVFALFFYAMCQYKLYSFWFDQIIDRNHDLPHMIRVLVTISPQERYCLL